MNAALLRLLSLVVLGAVLVCGAPSARAGTTGGMHGVVTADGAPLSEVRVVVDSPSQRAVARTDRNGSYTFLSLAPDTYAVTVEKQGYATQRHTDVEVTADAEAVESFVMEQALQRIGNP